MGRKYNVVDSIWFDTIGIVRVRNEYGEDKFYIGTGDGINEQYDEQYIAAWGKPYYPEILEGFFNDNKRV